MERINGYGRVGFEFADDDEIYVTANLAQVQTHNQPINGMNRPNLTIQCSNAFLPASIQQRCAEAGITEFKYGTSNAILPSTQVYTDRRQYRFVLGAIGGLNVLGDKWNYNGYYEHGINFSDIDVEEHHAVPSVQSGDQRDHVERQYRLRGPGGAGERLCSHQHLRRMRRPRPKR